MGRGWEMGNSNISQRRERLRDTDPLSLPAAASSSSHRVMDVPYPAGWEGRRSQGKRMPSIRLFSECAEPCLCKDFYLLFMHRPSGRHRNGRLRLECSRCNPGMGGAPACRQLPDCRVPHHPTCPGDLQWQQGCMACKVT